MAENEVPSSHTEAAQTRMQEIRAMREKIPNLLVPSSPDSNRRLASAASVPPAFIELTAVAVRNSQSLVRGGGADPAQTRDLISYADAYEPLAVELEALAQFVRHSVTTARNKAGSDALTTYALAQRLAKRPETADLAPHVREMRKALGNRGRKKAQPAVPSSPGVV